MKKISSIFLLSFIAFGILLTGCDSSGTAPEPETINGTWKAINSDDVVDFVQINLPVVNNYDKNEKSGCYNHYSFKINKLSGDKYIAVSSGSNQPDTLTIHVENDMLTIIGTDGTFRFKRSQTDISQLQICNGNMNSATFLHG